MRHSSQMNMPVEIETKSHGHLVLRICNRTYVRLQTRNLSTPEQSFPNMKQKLTSNST